MIGPKRDEDAQQFTLRNNEGKDVRFRGWLLAMRSTRKPGMSRWCEIAVYQTEAGTIVCHRLGRSSALGETDRGEVLVVKPRSTLVDTGIGDGPIEVTSGQSTERQILDFFRSDRLWKDLFADLQIDNTEDIA